MRVYGCDCVSFHLSPTLLYLCSYANFRAFLFGAILVHARHRETTGVLNGSPQCGFGFGLCMVLLGICVKEFFSFFSGNADPGEEQDHGSDGWKGYSRGGSW